jgi:hypothetical protein
MTDPIRLSEKLLLLVKTGEDTAAIAERLGSLPEIELQTALTDDMHKKAFWINLYNAFYQILRTEKGLNKPDIFTQKAFVVAGLPLSLDEVEHGILRKYRWKWSLGYLPDPFAGKEIRRLAVKRLDFRIHFALNCGAKSCPPIAFYSPAKLDVQLDLASRSFLENETLIQKKEIRVSRLFLWFMGDFGGKKGIRKVLEKFLQAETHGKRIVFSAYDWTDELSNFSE